MLEVELLEAIVLEVEALAELVDAGAPPWPPLLEVLVEDADALPPVPCVPLLDEHAAVRRHVSAPSEIHKLFMHSR